ncbi:predicted protein [Postia placenta Mad-698-R]|nr:predicted protein [Postia placenta Mad-698-R]
MCSLRESPCRKPNLSSSPLSTSRQACLSADRRQAPLGPDSPLFGTRIPPGTSTQSHNTSISPSTLFDTFDAKHDIEELALRAHLFKKQQLLDRISDPAPPLIDRIDMQAGPSYEYEPPKPLPDIHFQRTKILLRTSEYNEMFAATADRLEPVFARMEKEEGSLEPEVVAKVRRMGDGFDELYHGLEKKARRLTNRHWRVIKRDLKRIGHVSFEDLSSRLPEICNELASLNITFKYEV